MDIISVGDIVSYHTSSGARPARVIGFGMKDKVMVVYVDIRHPQGHIVTVPRSSLMAQDDLFGVQVPEVVQAA